MDHSSHMSSLNALFKSITYAIPQLLIHTNVYNTLTYKYGDFVTIARARTMFLNGSQM